MKINPRKHNENGRSAFLNFSLKDLKTIHFAPDALSRLLRLPSKFTLMIVQFHLIESFILELILTAHWLNDHGLQIFRTQNSDPDIMKLF